MTLPHFVWPQIETTGDNPDIDEIIEVALVVTDVHLEEKSAYQAVIDPSPMNWMRRLESNVRWMNTHVQSGLVGDLLAGKAVPWNEAEVAMIRMLPRVGNLHYAGADLLPPYRRLTRFASHLVQPAVRRMDPMLFRMMFSVVVDRHDLLPDVTVPRGARAMDRIRLQIEEMRHYRDLVGAISV